MLRPATTADRDVVAALAVAEETYWWGEPEATLDEAAEMLDLRGGVERGVVVADSDGVLGYASVSVDREALLVVDVSLDEPPFDELITWISEQGAREVDAYSGATRRIARLEHAGWRHARSVFDLHRDGSPLPEPVWPADVEVAPFRQGTDDEAVYTLIYVDAAWAEVPGHITRSIETWQSWFTPEYSGWVVRRDGRVVGAAMGRIYDDGRGWIHQLAIAKSERGVGLGRALLLHAFRAQLSSGASGLGLSAQARNARALGLYESVGLAIEREYKVFEPPA